jgi:tRNA(Met) cytidine acetyltransferase
MVVNGSGKGFAIRFKKILDELTPDWKAISLFQPIRWSENDPLEQFVNSSLLLDAGISDLSGSNSLLLQHYCLEKLDRDKLIENKNLLNALFGLLVTAHYQTKPSNVAYLLDDEKVNIYAVINNNRVLAVLCAEEEGGFSTDLSREVFLGNRRIKGHLIPQSLTFHGGIDDAAVACCQRIIRIAVHPALQRQGIGRSVIEQFINQIGQDADYIGTSFACTVDVLSFWKQCGFMPARLGLKRDASNGTHSLLMLKPVTETGRVLVEKSQLTFKDTFIHQLPEVFSDIEIEILVSLVNSFDNLRVDMTTNDRLVLDSFCYSHRGYEVCLPAIVRFARQLIFTKAFSALGLQEQKIIINKALKRLTWERVVCELGLSGKREAESLIKSALGKAVEEMKALRR